MTAEERKEIELRAKEEIDKTEGEPTRAGVYYSPAVDIYETDDTITLLADMPGVDKDQLDIDLRDRVLTVTGNVNPPSGNWQPVHGEYGIGGYTRSFTLGDKIDQSKISAALNNGVLTLTLPKAEKLKPRKIQVATA